MITLVTGAFGCIGSWVVRALLARGERPIAFDLGDDPWRLNMIAGADVAERITIVRGDITDRDALTRVVRERAIDRIIHLAAWQVPLCRQDPPKGALINVVGTANVFDAAKASEGRVRRVVYASSAGVFGPPQLYPPGPLTDDAPPHPATHYGVYKVANEETARVYWGEHGDRLGGATDLIFAEDVARALIAAADSSLDGARVYNLHGECARIADVVDRIGRAWPEAKGTITHVESPMPFADALDDAGYQKDLGPAKATDFETGTRRTLDEFARLQKDGRLDARELRGIGGP